jgi:hypothetical protein
VLDLGILSTSGSTSLNLLILFKSQPVDHSIC